MYTFNMRVPSLFLLFRSGLVSVIFLNAVDGIAIQIADAFQPAKAHIAVYAVLHDRGFELISGFAALGEPAVQIRLVDADCRSVFFQNLKPEDVVFMEFCVCHVKFPGDPRGHHYRSAGDRVGVQQVVIGDMLRTNDRCTGAYHL